MMRTTAMAETTTGFGHGKVILLGEHAVVYGHPALAAGIRAGVRAHVSPGGGSLSAPGWELDVRIGDDSLPGQAVHKLCDALRIDGRALDIWLESEIPARAGLGSSAAMAVAIARAVGARTDASEADVLAAATAAEMIFHRTPSGIDAAAASRGRLGTFTKQGGWTDVPLPKSFDLCIGISGEPHDTGALVSGVAALRASTPVADKLIHAMGELALAGAEALASGDVAALAQLFGLAHGLLAGVGVSTPVLDDMVHTARAAGALGAKLTGAGGGGAVIAIAGERADEVLRKWRGKGYYGFVTSIGHG
jgi:mevalonate kinase